MSPIQPAEESTRRPARAIKQASQGDSVPAHSQANGSPARMSTSAERGFGGAGGPQLRSADQRADRRHPARWILYGGHNRRIDFLLPPPPPSPSAPFPHPS